MFIISPKGGHGSNAVKELGGHFVIVNTTFSGAESDDILAGKFVVEINDEEPTSTF